MMPARKPKPREGEEFAAVAEFGDPARALTVAADNIGELLKLDMHVTDRRPPEHVRVLRNGVATPLQSSVSGTTFSVTDTPSPYPVAVEPGAIEANGPR